MRLLVDTDAFTKLSAWDIFAESRELIGVDAKDTYHLSALPRQLPTSEWIRKQFTSPQTGRIEQALVGSTTISNEVYDTALFDSLGDMDEDMNDGEQVLLATAAAHDDMVVLTGDKRALSVLTAHYSDTDLTALNGKVLPLESLLSSLVASENWGAIAQKINSGKDIDAMTRSCFSDHQITQVKNIRECLASFSAAVVLPSELQFSLQP